MNQKQTLDPVLFTRTEVRRALVKEFGAAGRSLGYLLLWTRKSIVSLSVYDTIEETKEFFTFSELLDAISKLECIGLPRVFQFMRVTAQPKNLRVLVPVSLQLIQFPNADAWENTQRINTGVLSQNAFGEFVEQIKNTADAADFADLLERRGERIRPL